MHDECFGLLIGARGTRRSDWPQRGQAVSSQPKCPPVRASISTYAGKFGRIGLSNMYVDCILKLLFLHDFEYVYQVTSLLCGVQINTTFAYVQIWKAMNI